MTSALHLVRDAGGDELAERLTHLDAVRAEGGRARDAALLAPDAGARIDVDVAIAGGGLSLLLAPALAARGLRVAVFERARAGATHREWNASGPELAALVRGGIVGDGELEAMIVARYRHGICRFHRGGSHPVTGVLDRAVDATALLGHVRALAERRGVALHDGCAVDGVGEGRDAIALRVRAASGEATTVVARVLVDARGASSPYASADMVCPTVGGVVRGLAVGDAPDAIDPNVGEILATIDDATDGPQHVWEAFPGRPGETTVYLFHYARAAAPTSLLALYARFFAQLGAYKRGDAALVRPTFGYIPGWSRLTPAPRPPGRRVVLVGDAAARHSPLTLCGFGAMLRAFEPASRAIAAAIESPAALRALGGHAAADAPVHAMTGALASVLARADGTGGAMNALLDDAFATLHAMGNEPYAKLLRDETAPRDFIAFLRRTAARRPSVYREVLGLLGLGAAARWGARLAREAMSS